MEVILQAFLHLCEDKRLPSRSAIFTSKIAQDGKVSGQYQVSWREAGCQAENWTVSELQALSGSSPNVHMNKLVHAVWSKHTRKWLLFAVLLIEGSRRTWNKTNNFLHSLFRASLQLFQKITNTMTLVDYPLFSGVVVIHSLHVSGSSSSGVHFFCTVSLWHNL